MTVCRNYLIFLDKMLGVNIILSPMISLHFYKTLSSLISSFTMNIAFYQILVMTVRTGKGNC